MARITTVDQFVDYVKLMLGGMVNVVEMSDEVIIQIIEDSIDIGCRYLYGEFVNMDSIIVNIPSGTTSIHTSALYDNRTGQLVENVHDVYDFQASFMNDNINAMFSPTNMILYSQFIQGGYPGGPMSYGASDGGMMVLSNYYTAMTHLKEISNMFSRGFTLDLMPASDIIKILPTPKQDIIGVMRLYRRETTEYLYNHILLKNLVVGKCKRMWGTIISKYQTTLPDGSSINWQTLIEEGKEMEQDAMERLISESQPIDFFIA